MSESWTRASRWAVYTSVNSPYVVLTKVSVYQKCQYCRLFGAPPSRHHHDGPETIDSLAYGAGLLWGRYRILMTT